jgi:hypothetical protein
MYLRNIPYYLILLLAFAALLTPFVDGFLFKQSLEKSIALQNNSRTKIEIVEYHLGWIQSNAKLSISHIPAKSPPVTVIMDMVIHHGPVIYTNQKFNIGLVSVESIVHLPAFAQRMIPDNPLGFMQMNSLVSLDSKQVETSYQIPTLEFSDQLRWDGMTGESTLTLDNLVVMKIVNHATIGSLVITNLSNLSALAVAPMTYKMEATLNAEKLWDMNSQYAGSGFAARTKQGQEFGANGVTITNSKKTVSNLLSADAQVTAEAVTLPTPKIQKITNVKAGMELSNINVSDYKSLVKTAAGANAMEQVLKVF